MNRVLAIIDVSNLYYTIIKKFGSKKKLDYRKLRDYCSKRGHLYRAICYASEMDGKGEEFFGCLKSMGFEIKTKEVKTYVNAGVTRQKANCDIEMVVDIIRCCNHYDELILVSSDGDMLPVVKYCQERGIKVHAIGCSISNGLRELSDSSQEIGSSLLETLHETNNSTESVDMLT